jgi:catechol 2,3-dioxygenase-like lactoylglutathione lyase family enzyme
VFDHVTLRTSDRDASERFYATVLRPLGVQRTAAGEYLEWDDFSLVQAENAERVTRGLHLAFVAPSRAHVDAFWRAGTEAGHRDDGPPGPRPQYREDYYGAFLLDPDGNSAEAVHHGALRRGGNVDHLWIRVADVARARRFYEAIAPHAGLRLGVHDPRPPDLVQFRGDTGSFSLVAASDGLTRNVHLAFPAADEAAVRAFHAAGLQAGGRDHGAPGERPEYHPGYYAAFVLDPDGHNVELVDHHRPGG